MSFHVAPLLIFSEVKRYTHTAILGRPYTLDLWRNGSYFIITSAPESSMLTTEKLILFAV